MKRYVIQSAKNTVAADHGIVTAELKVVENRDGPWVKYEDVAGDIRFLGCLQAAGVDNWEGYGYAIELLQEIEDGST